MPALDAQALDVGAGGFGDPQPIEGQQRDQGMLGGHAEPGGNQQRAKLVAVQRGGMRLIIQPWAPDMSGGRMAAEFFLHRVLVEPGDGAQAAGDGGPGTATGLQVAGEALDVGAPRLERAQLMLLAPAGVLAQVQRVRLTRQAGVTGQEPSQGEPLGLGEHRLDGGDSCGHGHGGHGGPPGVG
jgi:hypothetical protein